MSADIRVERFKRSLELLETTQQQSLANPRLLPHRRVSSIETKEAGHAFILDLGRYGFDLFNKVYDYIRNETDYSNGASFVANMVFESLVKEAVWSLNRPPAEAVVHLQTFPTDHDIRFLFQLTNIREPDVFADMFKGLVFPMYLKLRSQLRIKLNVQYLPGPVGRDYVVVKEIVFSITPAQEVYR